MQRNQGLPIQRLVANDDAVDIHAGLRAEQAEMHRRSMAAVNDGLDDRTLLAIFIGAAVLIVVAVIAVIYS